MGVFRKPGPKIVTNFNIPFHYIEHEAMVERLAGDNARFTYCIENAGLWIPVVQIIRPIATMPARLRAEYAQILEGSDEPIRVLTAPLH